MRKRLPGFYVSVRVAEQATEFGLPNELLDGPWPTLDSARRRAREMASREGHGGAAYGVVRIADDGVTVLRDVDGS